MRRLLVLAVVLSALALVVTRQSVTAPPTESAAGKDIPSDPRELLLAAKKNVSTGGVIQAVAGLPYGVVAYFVGGYMDECESNEDSMDGLTSYQGLVAMYPVNAVDRCDTCVNARELRELQRELSKQR